MMESKVHQLGYRASKWINFLITNKWLIISHTFLGSYGCGPCKTGYSKTCTECFIGMCTDIDECTNNPDGCNHIPDSECVDLPDIPGIG